MTAPEVGLSSPWTKEVRAPDICLNWLSVGRSQWLSMLVPLLCLDSLNLTISAFFADRTVTVVALNELFVR